MIEFCKDCGNILFFTKEGEIVKAYCKKCKTTKETVSGYFKQEIKEKIKGEGFLHEGNPSADYTNICKKCGYGQAQIIDVGILYSDEDNLILLKCGKCGFSERIGKKVT